MIQTIYLQQIYIALSKYNGYFSAKVLDSAGGWMLGTSPAADAYMQILWCTVSRQYAICTASFVEAMQKKVYHQSYVIVILFIMISES